MVGLFSVSLRIASSSEMRDNSPQLDKMGKKTKIREKTKTCSSVGVPPGGVALSVLTNATVCPAPVSDRASMETNSSISQLIASAI